MISCYICDFRGVRGLQGRCARGGERGVQGTPFPQAKCALGLPKGPPARKAGTWTFTREYEHASVFVDLTNRSAGHVHFTGSC